MKAVTYDYDLSISYMKRQEKTRTEMFAKFCSFQPQHINIKKSQEGYK